MVDTSCIGKESQHNAPQDHIRVSCKKKPTLDSWVDLSNTPCRRNFSHPLQQQLFTSREQEVEEMEKEEIGNRMRRRMRRKNWEEERETEEEGRRKRSRRRSCRA